MIGENAEVPVCREHVERITQCQSCQKRLAGFWRTMVKAEPRPYAGITGNEWNQLVDRAAGENQERLHSWAVANLYKNPNELGAEPF